MSDALIEYVELPADIPLPDRLIVRQFKRDPRGQRLIVGEETYTRGLAASPVPLDAERLARALELHYRPEASPPGGGLVMDAYRRDAAAIAREYAQSEEAKP